MNEKFDIDSSNSELRIRGYGINLEELFKNTMYAMFYYKNSNNCSYIKKYDSQIRVTLKSENINYLFLDFLKECLYLSDINNQIYLDLKFNILSEKELDCILFGLNIKKYKVFDIKNITYTNIEVEKIDGLLVSTVYFDI